METIQWGIIGCGDVTEVKSGPAFNKVPASQLVAVMRRDAAKVQDYARRHCVAKWYTDAKDLIADADVNAVYIATPPLYHKDYAIAALNAGKMVYIEKPVTTDVASATAIADVAKSTGGKISVAHYRREQPLFKKIKSLIQDGAIGSVRAATIEYIRPLLTNKELENPGNRWRIDAAISGGGFFHDLAPHQLDLLLYFFGDYAYASGLSLNTGGQYKADDTVTGHIQFTRNILFNGLWCFAAPEDTTADNCTIIGSEGSLRFSVFGLPSFSITSKGRTQAYSFDPLPHVQQPMIESVVNYFLNKSSNPCPIEAGVAVMQLMEAFTAPAFK